MSAAPERTALVTGSNNGIGAAIVRRLAKLDYKLVVTGRDEKDMKQVADECAVLSPSGKRPLEIRADLESESERERLFAQAMAHFDGRLNLLVNNAGFGTSVDHTRIEECYANYKRVMAINFHSAVHLTLMAAPALKRTASELSSQVKEEPNEGGSRRVGTTTSVINISSVSAFRPTEILFAYGVSKAALNGVSQSFAQELAPLIRVNCICPGPVETKIIERAGFSRAEFSRGVGSLLPVGRIGKPDEVAEAVLYLADGERAGFITGACLIIDGGALASPLRWTFAAQ